MTAVESRSWTMHGLSLVLLDALMPVPVPEHELPAQMARVVQDKKRLLSRDTRFYRTEEEAVAQRITEFLH